MDFRVAQDSILALPTAKLEIWATRGLDFNETQEEK